MSLLVDLAFEQLDHARKVLDGRPEELIPWKEWTCYKGMYHVTRLGQACTKYVDGRQESKFGPTIFASVAETELRTPYMKRVCGRSRWSEGDEVAMWAVRGFELPEYYDGRVPVGPMACVDLRNFYVQIMLRFSTQVEYRAGTGCWAPVGNYWVDVAELRRHKPLYASIVSRAWRSKTITLWKKGNPEKVASTFLYQPQAWRLLCDIIQAVAQEAHGSFGVPRMSVDEFWVPIGDVASFQEWLQERWSLASAVKGLWEPTGLPGDYWPLWHRSRLREQSELVRDRLAQEMTGAGPRDEPFPGKLQGGRVVLLSSQC